VSLIWEAGLGALDVGLHRGDHLVPSLPPTILSPRDGETSLLLPLR